MQINRYILPMTTLFMTYAGMAAAAAHADETIVSQITTSGIPTPPGQTAPPTPASVTSTLYFKGGQWRSEMGDAVMLAGGPDGKMYSLNPTAKTYYVLDAKKAMAAALDNPILAMLKFHTTAKVDPAGETKTIAGKPAKSYKFSATIHMSMGDGDDPATDAMMPTVRISGEEWTTEALSIPASPFAGGVGSLGKMIPGPLANGFSSLTTQLAAIKGFPLISTTTLKVVFPEGSPFAAMAGDSVPKAVTATQTATSISEAPLSDDLFRVPTEYKLVDAPPPPALPIPGGAGAPPAP